MTSPEGTVQIEGFCYFRPIFAPFFWLKLPKIVDLYRPTSFISISQNSYWFAEGITVKNFIRTELGNVEIRQSLFEGAPLLKIRISQDFVKFL